MRRNNKQFVRNIIIASIIGLITLMVVLFAVLQTYLGKQQKQAYIQEEVQIQAIRAAAEVEISENKMLLIEEVTEQYLIGYDINNRCIFSKAVLDTVRVSDAYGKALPLAEIKKGDIVEVSYQKDKNSIIAINKSIQVQSLKRISGVTINKENKQVNIGGSNYSYTEDTIIINQEGEETDIGKIGPFDIVSIQQLDNTIWSIAIEETSASINMMDLPTQNGQIEIDNSRLIQFKDIKEPIHLIPGTHNLVIEMEGYVTISEVVTLGSAEVYNLSLEESEIAYTTITTYISAKNTDYTIKIGEHSYGPGDEIKVPQGEYLVEITAEGYKTWSRTIKFQKEQYTLSAYLNIIEDEENIDSHTQTELDTNINNSRIIVLNTDPVGAKVYIDGAYKGETPYTVTLANSSYDILFEKIDYMV